MKLKLKRRTKWELLEDGLAAQIAECEEMQQRHRAGSMYDDPYYAGRIDGLRLAQNWVRGVQGKEGV